MKCIICTQRKGKRICKLRNKQMICSLCCAESRNLDCEGCLHYTNARQYTETKNMGHENKHFIAEINKEVENSVNQALALVEKGDIEKGEAIISGLMNTYPGNYYVYYGLGVVRAFKEQLDEAIKYFDKAIDIFPYLIEAHFNKGVAYKKKLDVGNMIRAFKKVVAIGNPKDNIVKQAKNFIEEMEQHVKKTEGIDLDRYLEAEDKFNEAFSCMEKHEWEKAILGFKACLAKNKRHPQSYGNMGLCYANIGQKGKALEAFDKALEIDPSYGPALTNRIEVESLKEGEKLGQSDFQSVEYYKDCYLKNKIRTNPFFRN